jgi:hypothetical protein
VKTVSRGACFGDYDNDGKVDAFVVNLGSAAELFHNTSASGHWLELQLRGHKSNRDGVGARIEITSGQRTQVAERVAGSGYLSQDESRVHFGLGSAGTVDKLVIHWPSGKEQTIEKIAVDQVLKVEEPQ